MPTATPQRAAPASRPRKVALIGAPTDVGTSTLGAAMGPDALRVAQLGPALQRLGLEVHDTGNLAGPINPQGRRDPARGNMRNLTECTIWNRTLYNAVSTQFRRGRMPIVMGGDHHLAIGSISAAARHCRETGKRLRVLWLDAHADCNTPETSPSGNVHGIPVAVLCGHGPAELTGIGDVSPAVAAADFHQVGLRSVDEAEKHMVRKLGIHATDMRAIDEIGMRESMQRALHDMDDDVHLHVSFDVDFLDPEIAPGTGTDVRGGATYREAQLCMEMIADTGRLASLDIMEVNPALDIRNRTAELAVDLVESLFGKRTLLS